MDIKILFEDEYLMVIDKPPGVVVNRVETMEAKTVQDWAEEKIPNTEYRIPNQKTFNLLHNSEFSIQNSVFVERSGIVHRLDKETSGCLIIAKTPEAFTELQRQFKERKVKKKYLALVHGLVEPKEGTIKVPLVRSHHDRDRFTVSAGGRVSETNYEVEKQFSVLGSRLSVLSQAVVGLPVLETDQLKTDKPGTESGKPITDNRIEYFSLLSIYPKTGRTHQIRVHFKYFGHPLVSDEKYGGKRAPEDRKWCPRIFLHAAKIEFCHPVKKNKVSVACDLPADLNGVLRNLKPLT